MYAYRPEKFASLYASDLGQRIWAFLTRPEQVARLATASELSKPAADRVKQMVGHMVRQILEQQGWVLDQADVKLQSVPFTKAARYRRPDWVTFHAFRSTSDPRDVAITDRRQNAPLPADSRWIYYATFASPLKAAVAFGVRDIGQLRQQIHVHGFQRVRIERMLKRA
jgi:hypothetical protein